MDLTLRLQQRDRRLGLVVGLAAASLGILTAFLSYHLGTNVGLGIALLILIAPVVTVLLFRSPTSGAVMLLWILGVHSFALLIDNPLIYQGVSAAIIVLLAVRLGRVDLAGQRWLPGAILLVWLAGLLGVFFHPSARALVFYLLLAIPLLGFFIGYGLQESYPAQVEPTVLRIATGIALFIAVACIGEWIEADFLVKSFVIKGPFLNGNQTAMVMIAVLPFFPHMVSSTQGSQRLVGWLMLAVTVGVLAVLVSRTAILMAIVLPILHMTRGNRLPLLAFTAGGAFLIWRIVEQFETVLRGGAGGTLTAFAERYRLVGYTDIGRYLNYSYGLSGIQANMLTGVGFGGSTAFMASHGISSYGIEDLFLQVWLEGGIVIFLTLLGLHLAILFFVILPVIWVRPRQVDNLSFALGLAALGVYPGNILQNTSPSLTLHLLFYLFVGILVARQRASAQPLLVPGPTGPPVHVQ